VRRYAAKVDDNHAEIAGALRGVGAYVVDCAHVGRGFPDLLVWWRGGILPIEVKDGAKSASRRKLTADQQVFHAEAARAGCPVRVVTNIDEALAVLGARRGA
jgi:hypothetical protein